MRKTVLTLLAFLMLAAACSSNDSDDTSTTDPDDTSVPDTASTDPAADRSATAVDSVVLLPVFRPAYDPAGVPAVYLHDTAVWVLETDDDYTARTNPDEWSVASRQASECYAEVFVSSLPLTRHAAVAAELSQQDLLNGFPLGVATDRERANMYILATPCLDAAWRADAASKGPQDVLGAGIELTDEQQTALTDSFAVCLETLLVDSASKNGILESALFDSPSADEQVDTALRSVCRDSLLIPLLIEQYVAEGFERDAAECAGSRMSELMANTPEVFSAVEPDPELLSAVIADISSIASVCGVDNMFFR